ncbi:MAG: AAA family ATPase [Campylobacterales bacterium]|nr:AAA family ATPase [Campylobacterales bacterium]
MFDNLNQSIIDGMERGVLATIVFDNEIIKIIKENVFKNSLYRNIFDVMKELYKNGYPLSEQTLMAKLDSSYENVILDILSTNPIIQIKPIYETLLENYYKNYIEYQLKKVISSEGSSFEKIRELENLVQKSKEFKTENVFDFVDFLSVKGKNPMFFLENVLPIQEHEINIISAPGGSGKSYVSLYLALQFIQLYRDKRCFLWLSEDEIGVSKKRANSLCKIHNFKLNNNITVAGKETRVFHFLNKNLIIHDKFELMKNQLKNYDLIILDPLIAFYGADENSNAEARYFMSILNKWCVDDNKTIILIHHHNKASMGNKSNARGASAFIDACRMHYIIERIDGDNSSRKLVIDKTNHFESGKKEYIIKLFDNMKNIEIVYSKLDMPFLGDELETEIDEL